MVLFRALLAAIPVLCVTAMFDHHHVARALATRCPQKPVWIEELLSVVHAHCKPEATS
jgi:hypothetical protein